MASLWAFGLLPLVAGAVIRPRLDDGLAKTPQMGWNSYNHYNCRPNQTIMHSNAQALVDLGLADLGYRYVTTDCGWTVADRLEDGSLTWNETLFPDGFPALGEWLHERGLLFGAYQDSGIKLCGSPPDQVGSLYHEEQDAKTFASWKIDSLKYDNCFSDAETNYPNVNYQPSKSPQPRFEIMSNALAQQDRDILFQICEWGIDFPALWAPALGHSWRIGNDIIHAWRAVYRTLNQAVPQTSFAGPGQWPDLDMLMVGNGFMSVAEEQTHFSLWAILKSPLTIGAALKDDLESLGESSLGVLMNERVVGYNQDELGVSATFRRRWADEEYEVWSGPLAGGRIVAAVVNWRNESRELTLDLQDVGVQFARRLRNVWDEVEVEDVRTSYTAKVAGHGTILVELEDTIESGLYPMDIFASSNGTSTTFASIFANTTSSNHNITINFSDSVSKNITLQTNADKNLISKTTQTSPTQISATISLAAGPSNTITIWHSTPIDSITITSPEGTYHPSTDFTPLGDARKTTCDDGFCLPVGSKISHISPSGSARAVIQGTAGTKYLEIDYINNEVAFDSAWDLGRNARNLTIAVNGGEPVRLEVPLSGRHSELFGPGLGWWDSARMGVTVEGFRDGENEVVVGNVGGEKGVQSWGADFVGLRLFG